MEITDAQVHVWSASRPGREWPAWGQKVAHRSTPFSAEDLLLEMNEAGVSRAVLVPPSWEGDRNDVATAAARAYPDRFRVMGRIDLQHELPKPQLAAWKRLPGMLGVRVTFGHGQQRHWLSDGTADWFWPLAETAQLPVMVFAPGMMEALSKVAARFTNLRIIVDHCGLDFGHHDGHLADVIAPLLTMSAFDNVAVKVSALPCYVSESSPFPTVQRSVEQIVRHFGPSRVMWGSDLTRLPCTYREWKDAIAEGCAALTAHDKEWVMGRAATTWLNWDATAPAR